MLNLTPLGMLHTAIGLVAVVAGFIALADSGKISNGTSAGRVFFWGTVLTCLTSFGIFRHGGFGVPHGFAILTLIVLAAAWAGERGSPYVTTVGYSFALFLHFIPATVETLTRLPEGAPYLANPEDPKAGPIIGAFFLAFLVGATLQVLQLRAKSRQAAG